MDGTLEEILRSDRILHPLRNKLRRRSVITPPAFFNAYRQMKIEVESILYREVMIWEEWHGRSGSRTVLQPYQMGSLFNTRKHSLPLLKCRPMRFGEKDVPEASLPKGVKRGARYGLVRFDAELDLEAMRWCVQLWRQPGSDIGVEEVE
ncbi:hypothetical protein Slin14017_G119110 [Septoria linicola]|nr:hypothetical protein Slin14017_G119110 [Septoria linicola]